MGVLALLLACSDPAPPAAVAAPAAPSPAPRPAPALSPPDPAEFPDPALRAALLSLAQSLPHPTGALRYERRDGPAGTEILRVVAVGAAPGSGVVALVRDQGRTYGIHGEASFADLVRQHDWQAHPPADLRTLADAACFEGMGALREVVVSPGPTLRLEGLLFAPPAPARPIVVEVGPTGAETVHRPAG